jgi:hypothetical protein
LKTDSGAGTLEPVKKNDEEVEGRGLELLTFSENTEEHLWILNEDPIGYIQRYEPGLKFLSWKFDYGSYI